MCWKGRDPKGQSDKNLSGLTNSFCLLREWHHCTPCSQHTESLLLWSLSPSNAEGGKVCRKAGRKGLSGPLNLNEVWEWAARVILGRTFKAERIPRAKARRQDCACKAPNFQEGRSTVGAKWEREWWPWLQKAGRLRKARQCWLIQDVKEELFGPCAWLQAGSQAAGGPFGHFDRGLNMGEKRKIQSRERTLEH